MLSYIFSTEQIADANTHEVSGVAAWHKDS
jgi:hypothetical protein